MLNCYADRQQPVFIEGMKNLGAFDATAQVAPPRGFNGDLRREG
jgi:hypothetical protein